MPGVISATSIKPITSTEWRQACHQNRQNRFRRGKTDRTGAPQYQLGAFGSTQRQSQSDRAGDLHRRLVAARARGRGGQCARRRGLRCRHCHVDGPKVVIETAEHRGVKCCGHNASQAPLAPKGFITGAEYKWETIYKQYASLLRDNKPIPNVVYGGYDNEAAIAKLKAKEPIWKGPIKDNSGKVVLDASSYDNYAPQLEGMTFLVDGVVGSVT